MTNKHRTVGGDVVQPDRAWSPNQVKRFVLDARNRNSHAWELIPKLREALLAEEFIYVMMSVRGTDVTVPELKHLWLDMNQEMEKLVRALSLTEAE